MMFWKNCLFLRNEDVKWEMFTFTLAISFLTPLLVHSERELTGMGDFKNKACDIGRQWQWVTHTKNRHSPTVNSLVHKGLKGTTSQSFLNLICRLTLDKRKMMDEWTDRRTDGWMDGTDCWGQRQLITLGCHCSHLNWILADIFKPRHWSEVWRDYTIYV